MKIHISYSKLFLITLITLVGIRLIYKSDDFYHYERFLKDVKSSSIVEVTHGERLVYKGRLGRGGVSCLSSYKKEGMIPKGTNYSYNMSVNGNEEVHYITLYFLNGKFHSYKLWYKTSSSSYQSKAVRVNLLKDCTVTNLGLIDR